MPDNGRLPLPSIWTEYERGGRRGSVGSGNTSHVTFDEESVADGPTPHNGSPEGHHSAFQQNLRHRRSAPDFPRLWSQTLTEYIQILNVHANQLYTIRRWCEQY